MKNKNKSPQIYKTIIINILNKQNRKNIHSGKMGNIQIDLLYFINNGMQNPFLDKIVPILYAMADVRVIYALTILIFIVSWKLKKDKIKKNSIFMHCCLLFLKCFSDDIQNFLSEHQAFYRP